MIREPTMMDKLLQTPPLINTESNSNVFYPDRRDYFTSMLFLGTYDSLIVMFLILHVYFIGVELDLLLLNILTMAVVDLLFNNVGLSLLLTLFLQMFLNYVRSAMGESNIARKTLVDDRFLI